MEVLLERAWAARTGRAAGDTLRLRTPVSHVRGTPAGDRAGPGGRATFYQMRGEAELEGRLGGEAVGTRATGFFETWGPPPE